MTLAHLFIDHIEQLEHAQAQSFLRLAQFIAANSVARRSEPKTLHIKAPVVVGPMFTIVMPGEA